LELEKFGIESKNETMEVQARYFDPICYLVFICKIKKYYFQNFLPSFSFSKKKVQKIVIWT
jgi:predicted ATPase